MVTPRGAAIWQRPTRSAYGLACILGFVSACAEGTVAGGGPGDAAEEFPSRDDVSADVVFDDGAPDVSPPVDAVDVTFVESGALDVAPVDVVAPVDATVDASIDASIDAAIDVIARDVPAFDVISSDRGTAVDVSPPIDRPVSVDVVAPPDLPAVTDVVVDVSAPVDRCALTVCGSVCVDLASDASNCGACGTRCVAPTGGSAACVAGRCEASCGAGQHACSGRCVSDASTASCGASCSPCPLLANGTATCDGTRCGTSCNPGFHPCASGCVSNSATATCGATCTPCPTPLNGVATCVAGACGVACNAGYTQVSPTACQRLFCGMPSIACAGGSSCPAGSACVAGGGCLCNAGYQAVTCAGAPCTTCPGADFYCAPVFCGAGAVLCSDGGYCPANSVCFPDSSRCICVGGLRAVNCAGVTCSPCSYPSWRCLP